MSDAPLFPVFLKLAGRKVVVVGGGRVAAGKLKALLESGALVTVVAPEVLPEITGVTVVRRTFEPADLDGAWYVVAAAPPEVNAQVAAAAAERPVFVNAVDDPAQASAYLGSVVRRHGLTAAYSTSGEAPALAGLLREAMEALLPEDLGRWVDAARRARAAWKAERIPMGERRPLLLRTLNDLYARKARAASAAPGAGFVWLVGAGPGDASLITRRGAEVLAKADLVLYDALVSAETLELGAKAQRFFVGKRAGKKAMRQEAIHWLMIRAARRGKRVVRLKCGDPFVFGRGGEEALALAEARIPFEVVPGVSAALSAPALAGIPVTHRGTSSAFVVVSGHAETAYRPVLSVLPPQTATVVVLMGLRHRAEIAAYLSERGWAPSTPAAVLFAASSPDAQTWTGTLEELARQAADDDGIDAPGTIVIGDVVSLAREIAANRSRDAGPPSGVAL